jgi:hypothetical protein
VPRKSPSTERARLRRDAIEPGVSTIGTLEQFGPLGADNPRRQLGRSAVLELDVEERVTLVRAGAVRAEKLGPSLGESLSQQMVITTTKRLLGTLGPNSKARVQGVLSWGGDGHQSQARFEWLEGVTVRLVGSYVSLVAELVDGLDGSAPNTAVEVGAFVGYGGPQRAATLCDYGTTTEGAPSLLFEIPPFASAFTVWANANVGVEWLDGTTVVYAGLGASAQPLATRGESLPIVPATHLRLTPSAAGNVIVTWELAI